MSTKIYITKHNYTKKSNLVNSREIVLDNLNTNNIRVDMAQMSNVGRKPKTVTPVEILYTHDLSNWVMDSGATCHMTPYESDFEHNSVSHTQKGVEDADGHNVPANLSSTILIRTKNDAGENITICLIAVLCVPHLERHLFSLCH